MLEFIFNISKVSYQVKQNKLSYLNINQLTIKELNKKKRMELGYLRILFFFK
jgi:pyruvate formate-lyase activating enzyme-like uncharacterized protein